ncbi:hypothetical protein N7457_004949 [Penicillium paradoxum]|uniref:uncharacterized protein n=1 Tax=Penicillium paradoxum TaxID=176176 RepID=UPI0025466C15|nr:uncharacterized protein N7457_004949 [Penicillium paradoxum]KAJ5783175.1 hypothetical protein N7457_004949 [Penicillium paradoxum]
MSFGFGIGDFIAVLELANRVRKRFVNASTQFQGISDDVKVLSNALRDIDDYGPDESLDEQRKRDLNLISKSCQGVLENLDRKLDKYQELGASFKSIDMKRIPRWAWERIHWDQAEIQDFRNQISQNIDALNLLLTGINSHVALQTKNLVMSTKVEIDGLVRHQDREQQQRILEWLSPINAAAKQADIFGRCQKGTGQWFLQTESFQQLVHSTTPSQRTVFCPGIPGAGKTFVASTVVNTLQELYWSNHDVGVAFFYCEFRERVTLENILGCILGQLARKLSVFPEPLEDLYDDHLVTETRPSVSTLLEVLDTTLSRFVKAFIVIDALDECLLPSGMRATLIGSIFELQARHSLGFLATSRDDPEIGVKFDGRPCLRIRANEDDIEKFLRGQIDQVDVLPSFVQRKPDLQKEIITKITKAVDGMFLLARLHFDSLKGSLSPAKIRNKLKTLSSRLDAAYEDAINRIESQLPEQSHTAKEVLAWIVCATRPLTPRELQHALAVEIGELCLDEENIPEINDLISICAGLVTTDEQSNTIRLAHYTTQEYLEQKWTSLFPDAHSLLGGVCVTYLNFDAFQSGVASSSEELLVRLEGYPFYSYSALNFDIHIKSQDDHLDMILDLMRNDRNVTACAQILLYEREPEVARPRMVQDTKGLHLSIYLGFYEAAKVLLTEGWHVDIFDSVQRTPLSWMAEFGLHGAVDFLLTQGADPNCRDIDGHTAISYAVSRGHEDIFQILRERGADMEVKNENRRTLLFDAVWGNHERMVKLLLDEGIDVNCEDHHKQTALFLAIQCLYIFYGQSETSQRVKIVELLLSKDVDLSHKDESGKVALSYAVQGGNESLVKLLLEAGADIEIQNDEGETALSNAVRHGHENITKLLLEWHANPMCKIYDGLTPLSASARHGNESMVRILLAGGVDPNGKDHFEMSALSHAALFGHVSIVNILLENHAHPNCKDIEGRTPLLCAAGNGHLPVVTILLKPGIDANFEEDIYGRTPLHYATSNGHHAVADLLSSMGCVAKEPQSRAVKIDRGSQSKVKTFTIEY